MNQVPTAKEVRAPVSASTRGVSSRVTSGAKTATVLTDVKLSDDEQTLMNLFLNSAPGQNGIFTYITKTGEVSQINFDTASSVDKAKITTTIKKMLRLRYTSYPAGLVERITPNQKKNHKELRGIPVGFDTRSITSSIKNFAMKQPVMAILDQQKTDIDPAIYSLLHVETQNPNDEVVESSAKQVAAMTVPEAGGDGDLALSVAQEASEQHRADALQQQLSEQSALAAAGQPVDAESIRAEMDAIKLSAPGPATATELARTSAAAQLGKELGKVPLSTPVKESIARDYVASSSDTPSDARQLIREIMEVLGPDQSTTGDISEISESTPQGSPTMISPPSPEELASPEAATSGPQLDVAVAAGTETGTPVSTPPGDAAVSTGTGNEPLPAVETLTGQGVQYTGLSARFHKAAVATFFDSWEKPNWDDGLYNNITSAGWSKASAVSAMRSLVKSEGPLILVNDVVTAGSGYSEADTIAELNEVLQLHFSLHRNMSRGPRVTKVGISLNQLLSSFSQDLGPAPGPESSSGPEVDDTGGGAGTTVPGDATGGLPSTVSTTAAEDPLDGLYLPPPPASAALEAEDTPVDLATAWNNRKYGMGASQTGLRRLPQVPQLRLDILDDANATGSSVSADTSGSLFRAFAARF